MKRHKENVKKDVVEYFASFLKSLSYVNRQFFLNAATFDLSYINNWLKRFDICFFMLKF